MSRYLRPRRNVLFPVALEQGGSRLLIDRVEELREALRVARTQRPFEAEAWIVLPDRLHCIWRLPDSDCDYSKRWGAIKSRFTRSARETAR